MNGEQAHRLQAEFSTTGPYWDVDGSWLNYLSDEEWWLFGQLYNEFYPDVGNLYRIPMMIRTDD